MSVGDVAMTAQESRALAARYWRAKVKGRPVSEEARRAGVAPNTLRTHAALWPEHLDRLRRSTTLRPWELERLAAL